MKGFFANIYEWFGYFIFPYTKEFGNMLNGKDQSCNNGQGDNYYVLLGFTLIISCIIVFVTQYYLINRSNFNKKKHWWIMALLLALINFMFAVIYTSNLIQNESFCSDDKQKISSIDCYLFGLDNAFWSLILFVIITSIPFLRSKSSNCSETTFWKP